MFLIVIASRCTSARNGRGVVLTGPGRQHQVAALASPEKQIAEESRESLGIEPAEIVMPFNFSGRSGGKGHPPRWRCGGCLPFSRESIPHERR